MQSKNLIQHSMKPGLVEFISPGSFASLIISQSFRLDTKIREVPPCLSGTGRAAAAEGGGPVAGGRKTGTGPAARAAPADWRVARAWQTGRGSTDPGRRFGRGRLRAGIASRAAPGELNAVTVQTPS